VLPQEFAFDGCGQLVWSFGRSEAFYTCLVSADEELGKVPFERLGSHGARSHSFQRTKEWVLIFSVHFDLFEYWECDGIVAVDEVLNLLLCPRSLSAELVARESEHNESVVFIPAIELFQPFVLGCKAAFAGCVDDKYHIAAVVVQVFQLAGDQWYFEV
jgi:hypothetical protein